MPLKDSKKINRTNISDIRKEIEKTSGYEGQRSFSFVGKETPDSSNHNTNLKVP